MTIGKEAVAVALEREGRLLLVRRSDWDCFPGTWEFPGGKVDGRESREEAARREVLEEAGLDVTSLEYLGEYEWERKKGNTFRIILFYSDSFSGEVELSEEHSSYVWAGEKNIDGLENVSEDVYKYFELRKKR